MRSRQLYAAIQATTAGTVYFDIPENTTIRGIVFTANPTSFSATDYLEVEVSMSATNQTAVTDAQGVLGAVSFSLIGAGTPANVAGFCGSFSSNAGCPVKAGTRIYLNATESGTATWRTRAIVWFD